MQIPKNVMDALDSNIRKKILNMLYDEVELSAYAITNSKNIPISISTTIEHLKKLKKAGLIKSRDASIGKLTRYHYKITDKGKKYLKEYYINEAKNIKNFPDIAKTVQKFLGRPW